jgi:lipoic acid synthetase
MSRSVVTEGQVTFRVLGDQGTRCCPLSGVAHGWPSPPDPLEPQHLADTVARLGLSHVAIGSVDRDDLRDGGATHLADCIHAVRRQSPGTRIELLTPDFRGRATIALDILAADPPDVMNHCVVTVPRLYGQARPGADYGHSLQLLQSFKQRRPQVPTRSGLMLGLGETDREVSEVLQDLRLHGVDLLTVGQYLQARPGNLPVQRHLTAGQFDTLAMRARAMGFAQVACGPLVRASDHADRQALAAGA